MNASAVARGENYDSDIMVHKQIIKKLNLPNKKKNFEGETDGITNYCNINAPNNNSNA